MQVQQIRDELIRDEGFRGLAYDDATGQTVRKGTTLEGFVTVGYGFCLDGDRGRPIPEPIADAWLDWLIVETGKALDARIPWWRQQPEDVQRALVNMAYQLGVSGLLNFRKMLSALQIGDRAEAARQALDSRWARQTPNRANRVAAMIRGNP